LPTPDNQASDREWTAQGRSSVAAPARVSFIVSTGSRPRRGVEEGLQSTHLSSGSHWSRPMCTRLTLHQIVRFTVRGCEIVTERWDRQRMIYRRT
jgi:hypothetical protein